jgi:outer membrane protein OmpA-like peptidoglycan-associated protein
MPRLRTAILPLFTALIVPAFGETATTSCQSWNASYCDAEFARARNTEIDVSIAAVMAARERAFAVARNAEIEASVLTVQSARASEFALNRTSCESPDANLPPCEGAIAARFAKARNAEIEASLAAVDAQRELRFAAARNAEIEASIAMVEAARARQQALNRTSCESPGANLPPCEGEVAANFAKARNAEIEASIAAAAAAHDVLFAQARNAEIDASIAAVNAKRERDYAEARTAEMLAWANTLRGDRAQRFAAARNAEADASIAAVKAARERDLALSLTHCKMPNSQTPRCEAERAREFAAARNAEIAASLAAVTAARERSFAEARNAEIDAAMSAYRAERTIRAAQAQTPAINPPSPPLETGTIRVPELQAEPVLPLRRSISDEPCPAARLHLMPVQFSGPGATVDDAMKPGLDVVAAIAKDCPAVHIEIHGYSDSLSAIHISRLLSELRAKAVMAYLVSAGVSADRLVAIGHGDMIPLAANTTEESRAKNRRVEFTIKDPTLQAGVKRVMWDLADLLDPTYVPQLADLSP